MKSSPDDFEELQKLLAMKRHEQPPPRFFFDFADRVLERLDSPEPVEPLTWRQRLGLDLDFKPALVCAWGVGLCSVLVFGLIASLQIVKAEQTSAGRQPLKSLDSPVLVEAELQHPQLLAEGSDPVGDFRQFTASVNYYASSPLGL